MHHQTSDLAYRTRSVRVETNYDLDQSPSSSTYSSTYNSLHQIPLEIHSTRGGYLGTVGSMNEISYSNNTQYLEIMQEDCNEGYLFSSNESIFELNDQHQQPLATSLDTTNSMKLSNMKVLLCSHNNNKLIEEPMDISSLYSNFGQNTGMNLSTMIPFCSLSMSATPPKITPNSYPVAIASNVSCGLIGKKTCDIDSSKQISMESAGKTPNSNSPETTNIHQHSEMVAAQKVVQHYRPQSSIYRGVTKHKSTGRFEAHLWDKSFHREGQNRKGRQVYLGGYDTEVKAARAYDLAALKYWGPRATINFHLSGYEKEIEEMQKMTNHEFISYLKRKSNGFSRGGSKYRGVSRKHNKGRWQARIGRIAGNKDLYLGIFDTEEEAAEAYDIAAIMFKGINALTNFDSSRYNMDTILSSNSIFKQPNINSSINAMERYTRLKSGIAHDERSASTMNVLNNIEVDTSKFMNGNTRIGGGNFISYPHKLEGYSNLRMACLDENGDSWGATQHGHHRTLDSNL